MRIHAWQEPNRFRVNYSVDLWDATRRCESLANDIVPHTEEFYDGLYFRKQTVELEVLGEPDNYQNRNRAFRAVLMRLGESRPKDEKNIGLMIYGALEKQEILIQTINKTVSILSSTRTYPVDEQLPLLP